METGRSPELAVRVAQPLSGLASQTTIEVPSGLRMQAYGPMGTNLHTCMRSCLHSFFNLRIQGIFQFKQGIQWRKFYIPTAYSN